MTNRLIQKDLEIIWHPYTQAQTAPAPIVIKRALGAYLYTHDGHRLFDGISSWWVNSHGHCHPHINQAIAKQAEELEHVIFASFTHEPAINLAEKLLSKLPAGLTRVFYSDNGSTAVEVALKMAYQYWQNRGQHRPYFVALEHSYHGDTFGAMAASERSVFTKPFWPLLFNVLKTPSTCTSQVDNNYSEKEITERALQEFAKLLDNYRGQIAGIIIEPMLQAAGGMRIFSSGFLSGIQALCRDYDVLLIADEVATGFYRTGPMFACEHENVIPDIMCLAKGLTGGYLPLAVTVAREEIYRAFLSDDKAKALLHGHSFTANPLGCAAALASFELFEQPETQKNIAQIGSAIACGISSCGNIDQVKNTRSLGTIGAIELNSAHKGYLSKAAQTVQEYCFEQGLYIRPLGEVIYLMPPLCSSAEEIAWACGLIKEAIQRHNGQRP